jgi:hypothetical protein
VFSGYHDADCICSEFTAYVLQMKVEDLIAQFDNVSHLVSHTDKVSYNTLLRFQYFKSVIFLSSVILGFTFAVLYGACG